MPEERPTVTKRIDIDIFEELDDKDIDYLIPFLNTIKEKIKDEKEVISVKFFYENDYEDGISFYIVLKKYKTQEDIDENRRREELREVEYKKTRRRDYLILKKEFEGDEDEQQKT